MWTNDLESNFRITDRYRTILQNYKGKTGKLKAISKPKGVEHGTSRTGNSRWLGYYRRNKR